MPRIDVLFDELLRRKGSDLHLAIGHPPLVRARGVLGPIREAAVDSAEMHALLFELLDDDQRRRFVEELDLDFAWAHGDRARFRANYFHKITGAGAVFRVIPAKVLGLAELRSPDAIRKLAERKSGLVLVTGPTGSGKSTTLAAMIDHINKTRACHVLTIEDPVEFVHQPQKAQVTHREVGADAVSFAEAIRSAGREDADVILVGELRTNETMKLALELASLGALVFGTVHTNSAAATIDRILNAFPAEEQPQVRGLLADALIGVVAQQLVRSADGKARVAVHEILIGTSGLAAMIRDGKTHQVTNLLQGGQQLGMQSMDMALARLVAGGSITAEAALEKALDKESFQKEMARNG
jgi:twitching motility protein PilT